MAEPLRFVLDGQDVAVDVDPKTSTLDVLREHLGVYTSKAGCSPQGLCGCCAVLVDGKPRLTCTLPVKSVIGKAVTTLSGLDAPARDALADAFVACGASQCGYCTPGIVLSTHALLTTTPSPTREEVTRALNLHTCRCTGYTAIYDAVDTAAAARRGEATPAPGPRPEGRAIALGDRPFVDDLVRPGMLHGAVLFAPVAVGTVTTIDTAAAEALPGVRAVRALKAPGEAITHAGDAVLLVAADSLALANAALGAVVLTVEARPLAAPTLLLEGSAETGDVTAALARAKHRLEDTITLAPTDPVFLEPEAALAVPVGDGLVVYSATHDAAAAASSLRDSLGVAVDVVLVPSGGSYGGKAGLTVEPWAAALARATGRPVRVALDLETGMRLHPRRAGATVNVTLAADDRGLSAAIVDVSFDGGAAPLHPDRWIAAALAAFPYTVPAKITARVLRSDNPSAGPIRGAGTLAVTVAVERAVDALAVVCGADPLTFRSAALDDDGKALIDALRPAWAPERGVAIARALGVGGARVQLTVTGPDEVEVRCNVPELGQGRDETLLHAIMQSTGLPSSAISFPWPDSGVGAASLGPVDEAAFAAGQALAEGGGSLAERVGTVVVSEAPAAAPAGWAGQIVTLDAEGVVTQIHTVVGVGAAQDADIANRLAEGATHMGVGVALSEEVEVTDGLPEPRFRMLGVLKPKGSPALRGHTVVLDGGARDVVEAAVSAAPAAIMNALRRHEGGARRGLPMKDSAAAKAVGVRQKRA